MADEKAAKEAPKTVITRDEDAIKHGEIHVRAVPERGFRRAGMWFSHNDEVTIPANSLSQVRYDAIKGERMLVAVETKSR